MEADRTRAARRVTFVMMGLGYWVCEIAAHPDGLLFEFGIAYGVIMLLLAMLVSRWVPAPSKSNSRLPWKMNLLFVAIFALPVVAEPLLREMTDNGRPLELQLISGLRNLGFALAACAIWPICLRLSGVVALFLGLFASAMGDQPQIPPTLALFALSGGFWLVLVHQASQAEKQYVGKTVGVVEIVPLRFPTRELLLFGTLALIALSVAIVGPKKVMLSLGEWFPTSGGTGDFDPFARYGTGDGKEEIAGDNARAAGMVESEKMIEDNKDALIDVVNDMYGPPHKLPKEQDRTVAAGKAEIIENHGKLAQNKRPSRDFDTARQGKPLKQKPSSQDARGLIEVEGRTPLHIRLAVYDQFENGEWLEGRKPANRLFESENEGGAWMQLRYLKEADWYSVTERHALKVADLESNLVPTPSLLTRFYIHRVDRADYYEWSYHGVLVLSGRRKTPSGVIVRTDCQTVQSENLPLSAFVRETAATPRSYSRLPDELLSALQPIASEWAGALPPGWPQVEAILDRLRNDYTLDPEVVPPKGHPAPVLWFLLESHRGPDYLFASAAALLLRSLDYSTRFCMGYYASPDAYDPGTQHTPVRASDFHAWPEILLRDGHWMVIEPTPGFEVLAPVISWGEWLGQQFGAWLEWAKRNFVLLVLLTLSLGAAIRWRRQLIDRVHTLFWRLSSPRNWQQRTLQTVQLLEKRARLVGCDRLATETLQHWCQRLECGTPSSLQRIVRFSEWAAYGPAEPPATREELETVCREVLREWSLTRMIGDR